MKGGDSNTSQGKRISAINLLVADCKLPANTPKQDHTTETRALLPSPAGPHQHQARYSNERNRSDSLDISHPTPFFFSPSLQHSQQQY